MTLELASVRDPLVRKVANPKEAYTGIVMASGDGETLIFVLVTNKALPSGYPTHTIVVEQRRWDKKLKKVIVTPITITFSVVHGITVLKVPPNSKAWCSAIVTEAFCRLFMSKCESPSILQVDRAPGHIDPVFSRLVAESGRMIAWTPAGTSGYVQACDDVINATIQRNFDAVSTDWLVNKVMELHRQGNAGSVANPTLEEICQIMAKSLKGLTVSAQRRAFEHCLLTLPTDGSLDQDRGSKNTLDLLNKYQECLVPTIDNSCELFPNTDSRSTGGEGRMSSAWDAIINSEKNPPPIVDFTPDPRKLPRPTVVPSKATRKRSKR